MGITKQFKSPEGFDIESVEVMTPGTVGIIGIDPETGEPEFDEIGTEHNYDDQFFPRCNEKHRYLDSLGKVWRFDQLVPVDAPTKLYDVRERFTTITRIAATSEGEARKIVDERGMRDFDEVDSQAEIIVTVQEV